MEILELEQELRDKTLCEIKNIKVKKVDGKLTICIDEFRITETETEDVYDVTDTEDTFESFETTSENVIEFFKGFYDAFSEDAEDKVDSGDNQYYTLGFDFGVEELGKESEGND
jgi:hypothetical protein